DSALAEPFDWSEAVAEVCLGGGAEADAGACGGDQVELAVIGVGGVNDCRVRAEAPGLREQLDRQQAVLGQAFLDLAGVLVCVDVQWQAFLLGVTGQVLEPGTGTCPNGVGGDAHPDPALAQRLELTQILRDALLTK